METKVSSYCRSAMLAFYAILFIISASFTTTMISGIYIVSDLGGDTELSFYAVVFFGLGMVISLPLALRMGQWWGAKRAIYYALFLYLFACSICALAKTWEIFLFGRLLQGIALGPLIEILYVILPLTPHVIRRRASLLVASPLFGACFAGVAAYLYHWQWIFYVDIIYVIIVMGLLLPHKIQAVFKVCALDVQEYVSYGLAVLCLGYAMTVAQELDWYRSWLVVAAVVIGSVSLGHLIIRKSNTPIFEWRILKDFLLVARLVNLAVCYFIYFGIVVLTALWLSLYVSYSPLWIVYLLFGMGLATIIPHFLAAEKHVFKLRCLLMISLVVLAWACFYESTFSEYVDFNRLFLARFLGGVALATFLPALLNLIMSRFQGEDAPHVMQFFYSARLLGCVIGVSVFAIMWYRRKIFYYDRLGGAINEFSTLTKEFFIRGKEFAFTPGQTAAELSDQMLRQATTLGLNDCFYLMGWIVVFFCVFDAFIWLWQSRLKN